MTREHEITNQTPVDQSKKNLTNLGYNKQNLVELYRQTTRATLAKLGCSVKSM